MIEYHYTIDVGNLPDILNIIPNNPTFMYDV